MRTRSVVMFLWALAVLSASACSRSDIDSTSRTAELRSAGPIGQESIAPDAGRFREVMLTSTGGTCTGTVIGPFAVVTAAHCGAAGATGAINWPATTNDMLNGRTALSLPVANTFVSPYIKAPHIPQWWDQLNAAQQRTPGGRLDDWPAMHDQAVLFVPG